MNEGIKAEIDVASEKAYQGIKKLTGSFGELRSEVLLSVSALKRLLDKLSKLTDYSDKLITSQRLLNTVLGENVGKANEFVNTMSKMTGVNEASINTQIAKFTQLGESFGMGIEQAEEFSESLTTLSTKLALLYNTNPSTMSEKISKALAGNKKMLQEATGIVATNTNMQAILYENGIDRQITKLNEGELAILRYVAITKQATSDMSVYQEAVNSLAWQKQMLTQQVQRLSTALGQLLTPVLTKVFTVLNAVIIAVTKLVQLLAKLFGISINLNKTVNSSGGITSGFDDFADSISNASKEANRSLRSFDKLNNITTPTSSGSDSGKGLSIDPRIGGLLADTNQQFLDIENNAERISRSVLEWLGFTEDENGELEFTGIKFGTILGSVITLLAIFKLFKGVGKIFSFLNIFKLFSGGTIAKAFGDIGVGIGAWIGGAGTFGEALTQIILPALGTILSKLGGIIGIVWGIIEIINAIIDINKNGWSFDNVLQIIRGIALVVARSSFIIWWLDSCCNSWFNSSRNIYCTMDKRALGRN